MHGLHGGCDGRRARVGGHDTAVDRPAVHSRLATARTPMTRPIITFTSDFGRSDWFVGVVHGVIHAVCPDARVVDLTHDVPPGHVARAAFVLEAAAPDFPPDTVHLAVVDPGVGTDRRGLVAGARGQRFVGPDNGVLEWALADPAAVVHEATEARFFRQPVSRTFHASDIFGPVAAHLARGEPLAAFGPRVAEPRRLGRPGPRRDEDRLIGHIVFVDHFGNALTNLTEQDLSDAFPMTPPDALDVVVAGRVLHGLARAYGDSPVGTLLAIVGSSGRLEIAQAGGDVATRLGLGEGDEIAVRVRTG